MLERTRRRITVLALGAGCALGAAMPLACGGGGSGRLAAAIGTFAKPLVDVRWGPSYYPIDTAPSVFNEAPLVGRVVLLEFFASW